MATAIDRCAEGRGSPATGGARATCRTRSQLRRKHEYDFKDHHFDGLSVMRWDKKYFVGSILVPIVLAVVGWWVLYPSPSTSNSISNSSNNSGIVTQGQTGNNFLIDTLEPETSRRKSLLGKLCKEYIFDHDGLSSALLAGTESVPPDWINKRLEQMGESWRVRVKGSEYEILP
jgi:hypothetical protein